ncbi:hypothetical protein PIB30_063912 [Stylosanthes scabra]|uniref:Transposase (putative) gypsy type domain-containing protein n=1 Tax=Stylosanthes scabra TaxID=79078 RepID=A0ABU6UKN1_9FABA|nr:hypothetical protein [Stylosanthes scabra]
MREYISVGRGGNTSFMYTTVFLDIGVRFPFTEFECGVLGQLKCAPTQIHPNAWAFIRGFEILMEYLGTTPLLEVFFSFFQAKGVRKGGVVTLNSMPGKALFGLYRQSYKDFKQMYVKVSCVEEQFPFYLDEFGLERFPLYWYSEPVQILGMTKVSKESAKMVEFLEEFVEKIELLSLTMLFKWDKEREYVERYLETTTGGLKNFFKNRAERGHSASTAVKVEEGVVVNQPPEKKRIVSMKRRRAEEGGPSKKVVDLTSTKCCGKEISLEEVRGFAEKQKKLHGYVGEEDLTSVWSEHFPFSVLAEEHFQSKSDFDLIGSVDDMTRAQFMQVYAARLLCLGRYEEMKAREEADKKKEESASVQKSLELERKLKVVSDQLKVAVEQNALKEKECGDLKTDLEQLKGKLQKFDREKTELEARLVELAAEKKEVEMSKEDHGYEMMAAGFERARKQAEFFYPELKFDNMDPVKVVHNGALVDDDEVDLEGGDDHDPPNGGE